MQLAVVFPRATIEMAVKITFIDYNGRRTNVEATKGETLMAAAKLADIAGIEALCGGGCICSTCHVYASEPTSHRIPGPAREELALLEGVAHGRPLSRLSCQILVDDDLAGAEFEVPAPQRRRALVSVLRTAPRGG